MSYQSVNSYDGKAGKIFEELTDDELEIAIATAASSFQRWRMELRGSSVGGCKSRTSYAYARR